MAVNRPVETAPRPRTNWAAAIVGIVILAVVGGWAYVSTRPKPAAVVRRDIVGLIPVNGEVIAPPSARADVMSPYRAPVDKVETSVGARVHRGDVLVVLSFPDIQAAVEQARVSVKSAETAYANAAKQYDDAIRAAMKQSQPTSPPSSTQTNPDQPGGDTGAPTVQATPVPKQIPLPSTAVRGAWSGRFGLRRLPSRPRNGLPAPAAYGRRGSHRSPSERAGGPQSWNRSCHGNRR